MAIKVQYLLILSLLLSVTAYTQEVLDFPSQFVETVLPDADSDEWSKVNQSRKEYSVAIVNRQLEVRLRAEYPYTCELEVDGGKLVGNNRGEWGGELLFRPSDAQKKDRVVAKGNIHHILTYNGKLCYLEGLAHLGLDYGGLYELKKRGNSYKSEILIDLHSSPYAYAIYQNKLIVAASHRLFVINDFLVEFIFDDLSWWGFYPNSVAVLDEENVFVGMRGGVAKINLKEKKIVFYKNT